MVESRAGKGGRSGLDYASESETIDLGELGIASGTRILGGYERPLWYAGHEREI